jgi:hypothetical protein
VRSVDPSDLGDMRAWCRRSGDAVVSAHSEAGTYVILIEHRASPASEASHRSPLTQASNSAGAVTPKSGLSALSPRRGG